MTAWDEVAPKHVAQMQRAWERRRLMLRMWECGFTQRQIGRKLGVSQGFTNQMIRRAREERGVSSPVERWMNGGLGEVHEVYQFLRGYVWHHSRWKRRKKRK